MAMVAVPLESGTKKIKGKNATLEELQDEIRERAIQNAAGAGGYGVNSSPVSAQLVPKPAAAQTSALQTSTYSSTTGAAQSATTPTTGATQSAATPATETVQQSAINTENQIASVPTARYEAKSYPGSEAESLYRSALGNVMNRKAFSYDLKSDPAYQAYAAQYERNGRQAFDNALAQLAARTGGLASSYAGTAAQQVYNDYMQALNDRVPELYNAAYQRWLDGQQLDLQTLQQLEAAADIDYQRWAADRALDYQTSRDYIGDTTNADNTAYERRQAEAARQLSLAQLGASMGDYSGLRSLGIEPNTQNILALALANAGRTSAVGTGGSGGGTIDTSEGIIDSMLGMGNDTAAYEYLLGLGYSADETKQLWKLYNGSKPTAETDAGTPNQRPENENYYDAVLTTAKTYRNPTDAEDYLNRMVDAGYISADAASMIYQLELGFGGNGINGNGNSGSSGSYYSDYSYAVSALRAKGSTAEPMTQSEWQRRKSSTATNNPAKNYASYADYLTAFVNTH